jgi:DNA processing protein
LAEVEQELARLSDDGVQVLCPFEDDFPPRLRDIPSAPALISVRGALSGSDERRIAIVGTRGPSEAGLAAARALATAAAANGWCVVSGLARGIDTAAHEGALAAEGRTIAVLGSGIRRVYPRENQDLAERIVERGALISEQPPNARPTSRRLTARNRLQSGLAHAVVVVETGPGGGSHVTASHARRQGKPVFAVQWPGTDRRARGGRQLLGRGAHPADVSGDLSALLAAIDELEADQTARSKEQLGLWQRGGSQL